MPVMPAPKPITVDDFAATFKPLPGTYEVTFLHPCSKCPVNVTFTLPPGCPKMIVSKRDIYFDYGKSYVDIRFRLFCVSRKAEVFQDLRVQALQIERRLRAVYEPNAEFFRSLKQSETQSGPSHPLLAAKIWLCQPV